MQENDIDNIRLRLFYLYYFLDKSNWVCGKDLRIYGKKNFKCKALEMMAMRFFLFGRVFYFFHSRCTFAQCCIISQNEFLEKRKALEAYKRPSKLIYNQPFYYTIKTVEKQGLFVRVPELSKMQKNYLFIKLLQFGKNHLSC